VLNLGSSIFATLTQRPHSCPQHIQTILDSLYVLTSARQPNDKHEEDWQLTLKTAQILRANLHKSECKDLKILGTKGEESIQTFVSTCLISYDSSETMDQSFTGWPAIRDELTSNIYGIIRNLLRLQFTFRHDEEDDLFTNIALSLTDSTQSDKLVIYFLSFLHLMPNLDKERYGSPFDGVILKILRSRWDTNCLNPGVWAKGHSQRLRMLTAGEALNPGESAQLTQLATEVMTYYADLSVQDHQESERCDSFIGRGALGCETWPSTTCEIGAASTRTPYAGPWPFHSTTLSTTETASTSYACCARRGRQTE